MRIASIQKTILIFVGLLVFSVVFVSRAQENSNGSENIFLDFDQDGLSNDEELAYGTDPYNNDSDSDGYSDYTEISSGYDPLKPAPGDRIIEERDIKDLVRGNGGSNDLTSEVSEDLAVFISSTLNKEEVSTDDMYEIVDKALEQGVESLQLEEIDKDRIRIKDQNYDDLSDEERQEQMQEDAEEYITAVSYILAVSFPDVVAQPVDQYGAVTDTILTKMTAAYTSGDYTFVEDLAESGGNAIEQLYGVEVPEFLVDVHIKSLQMGQYAKGVKDLIVTGSDDPLEQIAYISILQGFIMSAGEFYDATAAKLVELGIDDVEVDFLESTKES